LLAQFLDNSQGYTHKQCGELFLVGVHVASYRRWMPEWGRTFAGCDSPAARHPKWGSRVSKPYPALCRDCKHSQPEKNSAWMLKCVHPVVNARDPWALSRAEGNNGSDCRGERERKWFAPCGMSGKLWEPLA
jgi:hypothetical protein